MSQEVKRLFAFKDVNNVVSGDQMRDIVIHTCDDIINKLSPHCGPTATNAMVIHDSGMESFNMSVFTKDGIDILDNIQYISPIQSYIKNMLGYIGTRVDSVANDGTTTTILLTALILRNITTRIRDSYDGYDNNSLLSESKCIDDELKRLINVFERIKLTPKDIDHIFGVDSRAGTIAYNQSMSTSKGNEELSSCMKEIYSDLPEELFSHFLYQKCSIENDEEFTIHKDDANMWLNVIPSSQIKYNHALNTEYKTDDCDVIVLQEALLDGHAEVKRLLNHLDNTDKTTVIIYNEMSGSLIQAINTGHKDDVDVVLLKYARRDYELNPINLAVINGMAGVTPLNKAKDNIDFVIHNAGCHFDRGMLKLTNLCETTDSGLHAWYGCDPDTPEKKTYLDLIESINTHIDRLQNKHNSDVRNELANYREALRYLVGSGLPILKLGGKTMDITANVSVVNDVSGAVISSLTKGFVVDGNLQLYMNSIDTIKDAVTELLSITHNRTYDHMKRFLQHEMERFCDTDSILFFNYGHKVSAYHHTDQLPVMQPVTLYIELFKRLREFIPKFVATDKIIIPGSANSE